MQAIANKTKEKQTRNAWKLCLCLEGKCSFICVGKSKIVLRVGRLEICICRLTTSNRLFLEEICDWLSISCGKSNLNFFGFRMDAGAKMIWSGEGNFKCYRILA
jgi:hypothetical protein